MDDTQAMLLELSGKGYSCAQIVIIGGLRLMGRENADLTRAMGGLAMGVGGSGEVCGALAGAVCLLSLHTGKGLDHEYPHPDHALIMDELVQWFRAEIRAGGALTCEAILDSPDRVMNGQLCGRLIASAWTRALELLANYGIDPCLGLPQ